MLYERAMGAVVARLTLREYEAPADGLPREYVPARRERATRRFAELLDPSAT